jgi:enolase
MKIQTIKAYEILDSRGNPTLRVRVRLENGIEGVASVPAGASTGKHEALELRDGNKRRYHGKGVLKACQNVNKVLGLLLVGIGVTEQQKIDQLMIEKDGTENKSQLGANALLGVSLACARAAANYLKLPLYRYLRETFQLRYKNYQLPYLLMNILNGGRHADWLADIQEFMIIPQQKKVAERVRCGAEIFQTLHDVLKRRGYFVGLGDEGGYTLQLKKNQEAFELLIEAIKKAGYRFPHSVQLGIDAAASQFYNEKTKQYQFKLEKKRLRSKELSKLYLSWIQKYSLKVLEDPFAEDDWESWVEFMKILKQKGLKTVVVGDDLFVTNIRRLKKGIELGATNAILIKPNQIGTLSETMEVIKLAQEHHLKVIISHRSGETADTMIADLAVAVNADYLKTGSLSRSERVEKYNRLMEIERELDLGLN